MPVLSDFTVLTGADGAFHTEFPIGYGATENVESRSLRLAFNTGGRHANSSALLMLSVKGLTRTNASPEVWINGHQIGVIQHYTPGSDPEFPDNSNHWYTQTIAFDAGFLDAGDGLDNTLEITSVFSLWDDREGSKEDFRVRDLICFFHQRS